MPTRNINLTDRLDSFLTRQIESGRYKNASEIVRAGLRLLERQEQEDAARLEALRRAVDTGAQAHREGAYTAIADDEALDQFFADIAEDPDTS